MHAMGYFSPYLATVFNACFLLVLTNYKEEMILNMFSNPIQSIHEEIFYVSTKSPDTWADILVVWGRMSL